MRGGYLLGIVAMLSAPAAPFTLLSGNIPLGLTLAAIALVSGGLVLRAGRRRDKPAADREG